MSNLHLVAYLANAHDEAETLLAVATQNAQGEWHTSEDIRIWPYWSEPLERDVPPPPEGWVDHLTAEAQAYAAARRDSLRPSGLAALLARKAPASAAPVSISRRGF